MWVALFEGVSAAGKQGGSVGWLGQGMWERRKSGKRGAGRWEQARREGAWQKAVMETAEGKGQRRVEQGASGAGGGGAHAAARATGSRGLSGAQPAPCCCRLQIACSDGQAPSRWRHLVNDCLEGGQVQHPLQEWHAPAVRQRQQHGRQGRHGMAGRARWVGRHQAVAGEGSAGPPPRLLQHAGSKAGRLRTAGRRALWGRRR